MKTALLVIVGMVIGAIFVPVVIAAMIISIVCTAIVKLAYTGYLYLLGLIGGSKVEELTDDVKVIDDVYYEMYDSISRFVFK